MLNIILVWIFSAIALLITSRLLKGFYLNAFKAAMIASFVIGFLNAIIKPILFILTLPINILTLGLFTFVLNAIILRIAAGILPSFKIDGWITAVKAAIILMIVQLLLNLIFGY
jgi:putative membrane protein